MVISFSATYASYNYFYLSWKEVTLVEISDSNMSNATINGIKFPDSGMQRLYPVLEGF